MVGSNIYKITIVVLVVLLAVSIVYIVVDKNSNTDNNAKTEEGADGDSGNVPDVPSTYYLVDTVSNFKEGVYLDVGEWIVPGESATVSGSFEPGYSFAGWYNLAGSLVSKSQTYSFTPTDDTTLEFRLGIIHDASLKVDISDTTASNGVAEKRVGIHSVYSVQIASQKYVVGHGLNDPYAIEYISDSVVIAVSPYDLPGMTITHTVTYTDGVVSVKTWTYSD